MVVPHSKQASVEKTRDLVKEFEQQYNDGLITQGEKYNKVVDAWSKCTEEIAEAMMKEISATQARGGEGPGSAGQLDLHDGAFRRARFAGADAPARRHARPDGQAVGRDHREPDHLQLQGRALGARVLQLDARRAQGSRRHRAQDGEFRLSDAASRRRGAGLHHHRCGLRHDARHQGARHHRFRHGRRLAGKPHPRPHHGRGRARSVGQRSAGAERDAARGAARREAGQCRRAGDEDPLGAHLRDHERLLRQVLRARSRPRHAGQYGRGGGRHRRAIDRRAGHAAHHAHVPYRRRGADLGAVVRRVELRGRRSRSRTGTSPAIRTAI